MGIIGQTIWDFFAEKGKEIGSSVLLAGRKLFRTMKLAPEGWVF